MICTTIKDTCCIILTIEDLKDRSLEIIFIKMHYLLVIIKKQLIILISYFFISFFFIYKR